ncbi:MAG TPA: hypothetical protein VGY48_15815 [Vicinamibacterales bacterium]|jgi:hypothetical protein|nr:hypothetical protein [Vicinamibacterales bacterium]
METLALSEEEAKLLIDGLEELRDQAVSENKVKCFLGQPVEAIQKIDVLISKLRAVRS